MPDALVSIIGFHKCQEHAEGGDKLCLSAQRAIFAATSLLSNLSSANNNVNKRLELAISQVHNLYNVPVRPHDVFESAWWVNKYFYVDFYPTKPHIKCNKIFTST